MHALPIYTTIRNLPRSFESPHTANLRQKFGGHFRTKFRSSNPQIFGPISNNKISYCCRTYLDRPASRCHRHVCRVVVHIPSATENTSVSIGVRARDWGATAPQSLARTKHYFSGKSKFFGQKPAAKMKKTVFLYLLNEKTEFILFS